MEIDLRFLHNHKTQGTILISLLLIVLLTLVGLKGVTASTNENPEKPSGTPTPSKERLSPTYSAAEFVFTPVPTDRKTPTPVQPKGNPSNLITCVICEPTGLPVPASKGVAVTCRFRDPNAPAHKGLDLAVPLLTEVYATHDGTVVHAAYDPTYGNLVILQNDFYATWYAHNAYLLVREGDFVHHGDLLSLSGSTGRSSGPHLHYEVHDEGDQPLNPEDFLGGDSQILKFKGCFPQETKK